MNKNTIIFSGFLSFLFVSAVFGNLFISILYHESQHLEGNDGEAICFDMSGQSFAYAVMNKTAFLSQQEDVDKYMSGHYIIYLNQGIIFGILGTVTVIIFFAIAWKKVQNV